MKPKLYQRLPGRGRRGGFIALSAPRSSLWLGPDHLLSLDSATASETCRRFYFRDVEALIIRQTKGRRNWNLIWLFLAVLCLTPMFLEIFVGEEVMVVAWTSFFAAVVFLVLALINSLLGPICKAFIRTAVQIEELPTLGRVGRARKVFGRLRPFILEAQGGGVGPEQIARADWSSSPAQTGGRYMVAEPTGSSGPAGVLRHEPGTLHLALFTLLLADAALAFWIAWNVADWADSINTVGILAGIFLLILALRRQNGSDLSPGVKRLTWAAGAYYSVGMMIGVAWGAVYSVQHEGKAAPMNMSVFRDSFGWFEVTVGSGCTALAIGLTGLGLLLLRRKPAASRMPPPMPGQA